MRIIVRPVLDPQREINMTHRLVSVIAEELWRLYGGNAQLNWMEAERHLARIVGAARAEAKETTFVNVVPAAPIVGSRKAGSTDRRKKGLSRGRRAGRVPAPGSHQRGRNLGGRCVAIAG